MWPSGLRFAIQEITEFSEDGQRWSILEVKVSIENNNLDKLAVTEASPEIASRGTPQHIWSTAMGKKIKQKCNQGKDFTGIQGLD